jgi:hypothetical protein
LEAAVERSYASSYKGVTRTANRARPWRAWVKVDGRRHHLEVFETQEETAAARRVAVSQIGRKPKRWLSAVGCYDDDRDWFEVELTQGKWAKVDVADMKLVLWYCWTWDGRYAFRTDGRQKIYMHRVILKVTGPTP